MKQFCIVGRNSQIVKSIFPDLQNFECISHREIAATDISKFQKIFIFSWSHKFQSHNEKLLEQIPISKVVFISSIAVFSFALRKQWNSYPNNKLKIENDILKSGGSIIRIGVWGEKDLSRCFGLVPFTSKVKLILSIKEALYQDNIVINSYEPLSGGISLSSLSARFAKLFHRLSLLFPANKIFQIPFQILGKLTFTNFNGYSADVQYLFQEKTQIGYGVFGSAFAKMNKPDNIFISKKNDIFINSEGFRGFRIGKKLNGLAKYWHGVRIVKEKKFFLKQVPFFNFRKKPPGTCIKADVTAVKPSKDNSYFKLMVSSSKITHFEIFTKKIILAAGVIENSKILNANKLDLKFSDHEIGFVGSIDSNEILSKKYLKRFGPIIYGRGIMVNQECEYPFMLDFRPMNHHLNNHESLYNHATKTIIFKLISRFSFSEINEAFFNKFGFAFYTRRLNVFIQVLSKDCITMTDNSRLTRKRLDNEVILLLKSKIKQNLSSFQPNLKTVLVDGIHVAGNDELFKDGWILNSIKNKSLVVLGNYPLYQLNVFHHSKEIIRGFDGL